MKNLNATLEKRIESLSDLEQSELEQNSPLDQLENAIICAILKSTTQNNETDSNLPETAIIERIEVILSYLKTSVFGDEPGNSISITTYMRSLDRTLEQNRSLRVAAPPNKALRMHNKKLQNNYKATRTRKQFVKLFIETHLSKHTQG